MLLFTNFRGSRARRRRPEIDHIPDMSLARSDEDVETMSIVLQVADSVRVSSKIAFPVTPSGEDLNIHSHLLFAWQAEACLQRRGRVPQRSRRSAAAAAFSIL